MAEQRQSRIAKLLAAYGVGEKYSVREAARMAGISREAMSRLMREIPNGQTRRMRSSSLDKISSAFGIPRDLLEREMMADWGYVATATDDDVNAVLASIARLSTKDRLTIQAEIIRMQQARLEE